MTQPRTHLVQLALCGLREVPADTDWLTAGERRVLETLRFDKRRRDWLLGRWCARRALRGLIGEDEDLALEVIAASDGAPEVMGQPGLVISITHREEHGAAVAARAPLRLGCDLERVEARSDNFIRDYFTGREAAHVLAHEGAARELLANLCWSAKESVLKAVRLGLNSDTRGVDVALPALDQVREHVWLPLHAESASAGDFTGCWRWSEGRVLTVLADAPFELREAQSVS